MKKIRYAYGYMKFMDEETEKTGTNKNIVTICRNCGANLYGKGKCEYCGTVYPENIYMIKQEGEAGK